MDISKKLKDVRENKGLTIEELAEKMGMEVDLIKAWEEGSTMPKASELIELSKTYEMTMDEMLYNDAEIPEYNNDKAAYANEISPKKEKIKKAVTFTKAEKITLTIFPILCTIVYVCLGLFMKLWNIGWIVFLMIPIYFVIVILLRAISTDVDNAFDEYANEDKVK